MEATTLDLLKLPKEGRLGCLTADETKVLDAFRTHVKDVNKVTDPKFDDWYLLRFCRARKFVLKDVITMWEKFITWRKEFGTDTMIENDFKYIDDFSKQYWHKGYYSVTKDGYPVYIERYEKTDIDKVLTNFSDDEIKKYYVNSYEMMIHCIWPECSRVAGKRIDALVTILDFKGLGIMRMLKSDTRKFLGIATSICQDYYPECSGKMFLVNTGMTFNALWAVIKLMLDSKTRDKIKVLGSKFLKEITTYVDLDQLPKSMGGTNPKEVYETDGPWSAYAQECIKQKTYFADGVVQGDPFKETARKAKQIAENS